MKHIQVEVDPKELEYAQEMWASFTKLLKQSTIAIIVTLLLMAAFMV